jgi:GntR family transcriptional repressor for pyruvate dehydrogenase complex
MAAGWQEHSLAFLEAASAGNTDFHVSVAAMSGNRRLARTVAGLLEDAQRAFFLYNRSPAALSTDDHHGRIIQAIAAKGPDAAGEAMAAHLQEAQQRISLAASQTLA